MPPLQPWGLPAASSLNPPPPQLLDPFLQASPWSKKSRTTSHSMKMITFLPLAASPPVPLTKVKLYIQGHAFGLEWMSGWIFVIKWPVKSQFSRCSHFQNSITSPALVPRDRQNQHRTPAFPVQSEKTCFQPVSVWNLHHCEYLSIPQSCCLYFKLYFHKLVKDIVSLLLISCFGMSPISSTVK